MKASDIARLLSRFYHGTAKCILSKTDPVRYARRLGVRVGRNCRFIDVNWGSEPYLIRIGDHVSLTYTTFITHDGAVWVLRSEHPDIDHVAPITIGNNVFIGHGATLLPGVTVGDNVVIGARSVVAKDIPSNCVAAGVPARPIRSIEEYERKVVPKCVSTKHLSPKRKREFLRSTLGLPPDTSAEAR